MVTEHSLYPLLPFFPSFVLITSFVASGGAPSPDGFFSLLVLLTSEREGFFLFSRSPSCPPGTQSSQKKNAFLINSQRPRQLQGGASGTQWGH